MIYVENRAADGNWSNNVAEITRTRDHDPYGDLEYCVEWQDNEGVGRERYFKSYRAAERHALKVETELFNEAVQSFNEPCTLSARSAASRGDSK
jgi:hypothetical protein